ncbi:MAG: NAD(P)-binding domain-containing protein [Sorangiineae bacterium]|nr:NAD(P)-binding domain-containing protein [Polyangiaceae bacterium]MEB2325147.1 NAD(P)-binding domain-containing protein [Sorangiineae bacterium]
MRIAVLGTGDVGRTLASAFITLGHEVRMGSRSASSPKALAWASSAGERASVGTFSDAAAWGEWVVVATLGTALPMMLRAAGAESFGDKLVIDTTVPIDLSSGRPALALGFTESCGEQLQAFLPRAKVVKAFTTVGHSLMFRPALEGGPPDMFVCGDDAEAKRRVGELLAEMGWGMVDVGGILTSRYLEPMALVWMLVGVQRGGFAHAFKLIGRGEAAR